MSQAPGQLLGRWLKATCISHGKVIFLYISITERDRSFEKTCVDRAQICECTSFRQEIF